MAGRPARSAIVSRSSGRLLAAVAAVQVGADAAVPRVAGQLADVVHVVDHVRQLHAGLLRRGLAAHPAGHHHPGVERARRSPRRARSSALICSSVNCRWSGTSARQLLWLAQTGPSKHFQRLPKALVAQVRGVEDDAQPLHFGEQFAAEAVSPPAGVRARRVAARAVMRRAERPQARGVGPLQICRRDDRVGPFQAEDIADRRRRAAGRFATVRRAARAPRDRRSAPSRPPLPSPDTRPIALAFGPRRSAGCASRAADCRARRRGRSASPRTGRPCRGASRAECTVPRARSTLSVRPCFAAADLADGPRQIAVPLQGVHAQIEMGVEDEHGKTVGKTLAATRSFMVIVAAC